MKRKKQTPKMPLPTNEDHEQNAFFREITEDLREQKIKDIWKKYGTWLIGITTAIILTIATIQILGVIKQKTQLKEATTFENAMQSQSAKALETLATEGKYGYSDIAAFHQADSLFQAGKKEEAIEKLRHITNTANHKIFKNLAIIKLAYHTADNLTQEELDQLLKPLKKKSAPWHDAAQELKAFFALKQNQKEEALKIFKKLAGDDSAPTSIRATASEMTLFIKSQQK